MRICRDCGEKFVLLHCCSAPCNHDWLLYQTDYFEASPGEELVKCYYCGKLGLRATNGTIRQLEVLKRN